MTLSDVASFSTALSGIAVTGSIIYLAIQTHQAAKHTRALIQQGATDRVTAITIGMSTAENCAAWIKGCGGKATSAEVQKRQFALHCATAFNAMEDLFLQNCDGLLNAEHFARECETFRGLLSEPGVRAFWGSQEPRFCGVAPKFCAFVQGLADREVTGYANNV